MVDQGESSVNEKKHKNLRKGKLTYIILCHIVTEIVKVVCQKNVEDLFNYIHTKRE